jgi:hypothetical protein
MWNEGTAVRDNPHQVHLNTSQSLETKSLRLTYSVQLIPVTVSWAEHCATRRVMGMLCEFGCTTAEQEVPPDSARTLLRLLLRKAPGCKTNLTQP